MRCTGARGVDLTRVPTDLRGAIGGRGHRLQSDSVATVLVVDDDDATRRMFVAALHHGGHRTLEAASGSDALALLYMHAVDLVLLDMEMPGLTGVDLAGLIRADPRQESMPIIFVSGSANLDSRIAGLEAGGSDYLVKPVALEELLARVSVQLRDRSSWAARLNEQLAGLRQDTLDSMTAELAALDETGVIVAVNHSWRTFARVNGGGAHIGENYLRVCDEAADDPVAQQVAIALRQLLTGERDSCEFEYPCHSPTERRWFAMRAIRYRGVGHGSVVLEHVDITDRRVAVDDSRVQADLLDQADAAVIATDTAGLVTSWNTAAHRLFGWAAGEVLGHHVADVIITRAGPEGSVAAVTDLRRESWVGQVDVARKDGSVFPADIRRAPLVDADDVVTGYIGIVLDVTERVRSQHDLAAARDHLRAVTDSMGEGLCTLGPTGRINYLNAKAHELLATTGQPALGATLASFLHREDEGEADLPFIDQDVGQRTAFRLDHELLTSTDGTRVPVSITATPLAMGGDGDSWVVVLSDIRAHKAREVALQQEVADLSWVTRLRDAIATDALVLYCQPIIDLATRRAVQHELLLRLDDPHEGIVPPGDFIPAAERLGFMATVDRWVVDRGLDLASDGFPVEINLSGNTLGEADFAVHVKTSLQRCGTDPANVVFEVTETALVHNIATAHRLLQGLRDLGCRVALDDFGSGYASFTYLKTLPVDYLKIDREFIADLTTSDASRHVVRAVVNLAKGFGQTTIAEGVEDEATVEQLRLLGVDYAQGYLFGRPAPTRPSAAPHRGG